MMNLLDIGIDNAIAMRISGKITECDMAMVLDEMKEKVKANGDIVVFEQIDSFEGVEFLGIVEKFKYLFNMGISNISKVAIVTDKKWLAKVVSLEDKLFKKIQVKCYPLEEKEQAIDFLR